MADRGISEEFLLDLEEGCLSPLLQQVKKDDTLHLSIRNECINIYYRGGNLLKISRHLKTSYQAEFNWSYFQELPPETVIQDCQKFITKNDDMKNWLFHFPRLKQEMDFFFSINPKLEREYQQLVARSNNTRHAGTATDYFIIDIEYAEGQDRFDMIAAYWESSAPAKKAANARIAFIEMKYGDNALRGNAGIKKHIEGMNSLTLEKINRIKNESLIMFNQQVRLQLIQSSKNLNSFTNEMPEFILFLMDHDPDSTILRDEINDIVNEASPILQNFELKFCASNFMGLGIFKENVYDLLDFRNRMSRQICSKIDENL